MSWWLEETAENLSSGVSSAIGGFVRLRMRVWVGFGDTLLLFHRQMGVLSRALSDAECSTMTVIQRCKRWGSSQVRIGFYRI
jgi:hypothetical protein